MQLRPLLISLAEILLLFFILIGVILSFNNFFAYNANIQDFATIIFLASVAVWTVFLWHKKRWLLLPTLLFTQTRKRLTARQRRSLAKNLFLTVAEVVGWLLIVSTLVRACYRHFVPFLFYTNSWYETVINCVLLSVLILVPVAITHFILRRTSNNILTTANSN